jgi:predicted transcriptional regulator
MSSIEIKINSNFIKKIRPRGVIIDSKTEKYLIEILTKKAQDFLEDLNKIDQGKISTVTTRYLLSLKGYNICL